MRSPITIAFFLGVCLAAGTGSAQTGTIEIVSDDAGADVMVDSVRVGAASERYFSVPTGPHLVSLIREMDEWDSDFASDSVVVSNGDTSHVSLHLPKRFRIESFPIGAEIAWEAGGVGSVDLGNAPVWFEQEETPGGHITATLPGYEPVSIDAGTLVEGGSTLMTLTPEEAPNARQAELLPTARSNTTRRIIDYGLVAGAVAATALAVHFKFQANDLDDQYRNPESDKFGDGDTLQRVQEFDTYSTVALGASTVALGVLSVRFILR